jgi:hypothetical protein
LGASRGADFQIGTWQKTNKIMEAQTDSESVAERLLRITEELKTLEQLIVSGDFSPRILTEFRNAVDSVRQTARVVQMWMGLQEQHRDPYSVMSTLSADRVRRATQIAQDLTIDLQSLEVDFGTKGIRELFQAIDGLHERLAPLVRAGDRLC